MPVRGATGDAVLKVSWPHAEAATESLALRWRDGAGTVRLLAEDRDTWAMLLTRIRQLAGRLDLPAERIAAWGIARDVQGGLWAASEGNAALGAKWIRSATITAPMLS
jgi:streptomycin 6-kinase